MNYFIVNTKKSNNKLIHIIRKGLDKHRILSTIIRTNEQLRECINKNDLVFQIANINSYYSNYLRKNNINRLIFDAGFIRRNNYSISLNGIKGDGKYILEENPSSSRWEKFGCTIYPWKKKSNKPILILGQTLFAFKDYVEWLENTIKKIRKIYPNRKIMYSPHPNCKNVGHIFYKNIDGLNIVKPLLPKLSEQISFAVGRTTNATVEMIIRGVPVYTDDKKCISYKMSSQKLSKQVYPDREKWLYNLANNEWSVPEIRNGKFWKFIKDRLNDFVSL